MAESRGADESAPDAIVIKKYANRRLYDTASSSYVTLDDLCRMVREGVDFVVRDARSGDDITHQVLTQIIVEQEAKGQNLLPPAFLRQMIRLYGDSLQAFVPRYLDLAMETLARNRGDLRARMDDAPGGLFPVAELEDMARRNVETMQRAMAMFAPFPAGHGNAEPKPEARAAPSDVGAVLDRLDKLQAQLDALSARSRKDNQED